ncbi:MAG TPA: phosphatase PAP2 family protein [archaeon]|nr:phosphatase PAP2 family protein [archaeon]
MYEAFWSIISSFGEIAYWIGFAVSLFVIHPLLDKKDVKKVGWIFYSLLPSVFLASLSAGAMKIIFAVARPCIGLASCPTSYSFPSGHASIIFAFATVIILYEKKYRSYLWAIPLALLVGLSRIALGYHTPIDVLGGAFVGMLIGILVYRFENICKNIVKMIGIKV